MSTRTECQLPSEQAQRLARRVIVPVVVLQPCAWLGARTATSLHTQRPSAGYCMSFVIACVAWMRGHAHDNLLYAVALHRTAQPDDVFSTSHATSGRTPFIVDSGAEQLGAVRKDLQDPETDVERDARS